MLINRCLCVFVISTKWETEVANRKFVENYPGIFMKDWNAGV